VTGVTEAIAAGHAIRVINYHNTPESSASSLRRELADLRRRYDPVTLDDLDTFFATGRWAAERPGLLPVFYEGYRNSATVAGPACDDTGFVGWFPVCTAFVDTAPEHQEVFARSHDIDLVAEEVGAGRVAMSVDEVHELSRRHVVVAHTAAHVGIADVITDDDLEREVARPKRRLDEVTGQDCAAFVWLHGTPWGGHPRQDAAIVAAGYRYVISNTMIQRIA
jgi:peptidoglycan/xylan/chitin deacetylase (PgdA/CDA1 family)